MPQKLSIDASSLPRKNFMLFRRRIQSTYWYSPNSEKTFGMLSANQSQKDALSTRGWKSTTMNSGLRDQSDFNFAIEYDYESKPITPLNAITIKKKKWEPTSKYNRTLNEVRNQATPGELYRRYYLEFGKHEKNLAALAERTVLHHEVCAKAVLALQSRLRGRKG